MEVARARLRAQRLIGPPLATPEAVVGWLGAVQAQDFAGAKWALALRTRGASDAEVEAAFAAGRILRTHVLRPTWHFVLPADLGWMLALTAPRLRAAMAWYDRQLGLDEGTVRRSQAAIAKAVQDQPHTRAELARVLAAAGVSATGQRLGHLMMRAELDAVVCSGPRRGKQHTYALLAERAPRVRVLPRNEALAQLAARYFASHGPALTRDFAWWAGLKLSDAQLGVEGAGLASSREDGQTHWHTRQRPAPAGAAVHLLPSYDELLVAYQDRSATVDAAAIAALGGNALLVSNQAVVRDGRVVGTWRRTLAKNAALVEIQLLGRHGVSAAALSAAAQRYGRFLDLPVRVTRVYPARP